MYTICISGPETTRAQAIVALEDARIPVLPQAHHNAHWGAKVPLQAGHAVLVAEHDSVDAVAALVGRADWVLRSHHEAQAAPQPDPLTQTLEAMRREIDALRAKVGI